MSAYHLSAVVVSALRIRPSGAAGRLEHCSSDRRSRRRLALVYGCDKEERMTVLNADKVLDCTGMLCPLPVIKTAKAIKELQVGQVLKMIATDPGAVPDMEAWSRQTG